MKKIVVLLCLTVALTGFVPAFAQDAAAPAPVIKVPEPDLSSLSLKSRRVVADFRENKLPGLVQQIQDAAGVKIPVTVDWVSICEKDYEHLWKEAWEKQYFEPMVAVLKEVTKDEMGKKAFAATVKRIHFCNTKDNSSKKKAATFADGVLTIDHRPCSNIPSPGGSAHNEAIKYYSEILLNNL